mmetsp:Transcript_9059/g.16358  ORF Transcript_9059/g.16358 Transcript_9059/m.16358 type:complete len:270 (-) Transcript_9059:3-812(-)
MLLLLLLPPGLPIRVLATMHNHSHMERIKGSPQVSVHLTVRHGQNQVPGCTHVSFSSGLRRDCPVFNGALCTQLLAWHHCLLTLMRNDLQLRPLQRTVELRLLGDCGSVPCICLWRPQVLVHGFLLRHASQAHGCSMRFFSCRASGLTSHWCKHELLAVILARSTPNWRPGRSTRRAAAICLSTAVRPCCCSLRRLWSRSAGYPCRGRHFASRSIGSKLLLLSGCHGRSAEQGELFVFWSFPPKPRQEVKMFTAFMTYSVLHACKLPSN